MVIYTTGEQTRFFYRHRNILTVTRPDGRCLLGNVKSSLPLQKLRGNGTTIILLGKHLDGKSMRKSFNKKTNLTVTEGLRQ